MFGSGAVIGMMKIIIEVVQAIIRKGRVAAHTASFAAAAGTAMLTIAVLLTAV